MSLVLSVWMKRLSLMFPVPFPWGSEELPVVAPLRKEIIGAQTDQGSTHPVLFGSPFPSSFLFKCN